MKNSILEKARWLREVALATSKNNGARVAREWLKYAAMFVMLFTIGSGNAWGYTGTFTQSTGTLTSGYYVIGNVENSTIHAINNTVGTSWIKYTDITISDSKITNPSDAVVWYYDASAGTIKNVDDKNYIYWTSSNVGCCGTTSYQHDVTETSTSGVYNIKSHATPTRILAKNGTSGYRYYAGTQTKEIQFWKLGSTCSNKVTISKGSETNGTFTISPSGSQASCDGVAVMVTPTPASSAYYCSAVSASTGETGIDNGNGTWTVNIAANTTGTSTINVTFSLKTSYTVTWYNEGASIGTESVYSGDKVSALPSPAPASSCSGEFIGWVRSDADVADKSVTDAYTIHPTAPTLFTDVAGSPTITGNTAFHAVYRMPKQD